MLRTLVEENQNTKKELQRKLTKTNKEVVVWKSKYETDAVQRIEELESTKNKLLGRLTESEERCGAAQSRCASLEATKSRLQGDVENLSADLETSNQRESQDNFNCFQNREFLEFSRNFDSEIFKSWTKNKDSSTKPYPMQRASKRMH